jgi:hypothetical protein
METNSLKNPLFLAELAAEFSAAQQHLFKVKTLIFASLPIGAIGDLKIGNKPEEAS